MRGEWFALPEDVATHLTEDQRRLLDEARAYLDRLGSDEVHASGSSATVEPVQTTWGRFRWPGTLWIILEIGGPRSHDSIQLGMSASGVIVGGHQDRHYAWDDDRAEAFRSHADGVGLGHAISSALAWLGAEISRIQ
jgi:hypothetical protein